MYVVGENALDACTRESLQTDRDIVGCNCFVPQKKYLKCRHCLFMTFLGASPLLLSNHISILHYLRIDITQIEKSGTPVRLILSTAVWIGSEVCLLKAVSG